MILKYELKKVFSKKLNRIVLIAALLAAAALSVFAIGSVRYVDEDGVGHTGLTASRRLVADRNRWAGELTGDKIAQVVNSRKEIKGKYPDEVPDKEYGKTVQSYNDIENFVIGVLTPDMDWNQSVLYQLEDEQAENLYSIYGKNLQEMAGKYGETPEQQRFLAEQYEKTELPLPYEAKNSWDTIMMYVETYGMILAIVIGFLAAGIFAEEFRSQADAVFFSARYGRTKAAKHKVMAGLLMTTIVCHWFHLE